MLSVTNGHSVHYLTGEVAKGREGYYTGAVVAGEPPGLWWGAGAEALGLNGIVDAELMEALYTHLLDPRDAAAHSRATWGEAAALCAGHRTYKTAQEIYEKLIDAHPDAGPEERAGLRAQAGRSARQAVAFVDMTFSAPKSVTVTGAAFERLANDARAAGDLTAAAAWDTHARAVEDAVMSGARAALTYVQDHAGFARVGHHGGGAGRWTDAHAFVVAQFLQHDSRERDPQWHVHNAILNRVLCEDGTWRALDGQALRAFKAAAGAIAERVMEAHLARSIGVRAETRPDGKARELVGVDPEVMDLFSARRHQIGPKVTELIGAFEQRFGREPSLYERTVLAEQATLSTRRGKVHDGQTREQQLDRWEQACRTRIAGGLSAVAEAVLERAQQAGPPAEWSPLDVIERALVEVGERRQHYSYSDLLRAVSDALPGHLDIAPEDVRPLLEGLTDAALDLAVRLTPPADSAADVPAELLLSNGRSVHERPGSVRYSTRGQLAAERSLIDAAVERGTAQLTDAEVDAVTARFSESGVRLGADQAAALRGVLTSGAQVEVLTAAAGTGKSFVVGAIADTWTQPGPDGEQRRVVGLAPYQVAAEVLAGEGLDAANVAAWLAAQRRIELRRTGGGDERWRLRRDDLVVVDEAGTADTTALVEIRQRCQQAGAKLLLVGDPKQLTAIGPGGALADVAEHGIGYQLTEVRRFSHDWEGPASLRLRDGDPAVLAEYAKHGRLVDGGTAEQAEAAASRAWLADTLAGRESLLLVGTNASAARVSAALRAELVALGRVQEHGVTLGMAEWEGVTAGVGDLVQARALAWHLRGFDGNTAAPVTRQTYRVTALRPDGGLTVAPILDRAGPDGAAAENAGERNAWGEQLGTPMQLPAAYVREHLSLGYASTRDAAQGRSVDTGHAVVGAGTDSAGLYVPATRGRDRNTIYTVTRHLAPDAQTGETLDATERGAADVLADVLANAHEDRSASAEQAHAEQEAASTMTHVDRMADVIREVTAGRVGALLDRLAATGQLPAEQRTQLAADDAFGSLERLLRVAELAGHDPDRVLQNAVTARSLDSATSPAQVLHHRITNQLAGQLTPRIRTGTADLIPRDVGSDAHAAQRAAWLHHHADAADLRRHELGTQTAEQAPAWAVDALGPVPDAEQVIARQDWEHRAGWAAAYRELVGHTDEHDPLGAAPGAGRVEHATIFRAAHEALALVDAGDEEANMSDGRLRAHVAAYERELNWAPPYVADDLAAAHQQAERVRGDAQVWEARADAPGAKADERDRFRVDAAAARAQAEQLDQQIADLYLVDQARAEWFLDSAVSRDRAERGRVELKARGVDPDNTADRTTAAEWLAAHRAEQAAEDEHREIDHLDDRPDTTDTAVGRAAEAVETDVPDIRATSIPDRTEKADPGRREPRRDLDETAAAVGRSQLALAEIANRRAADAAHEAEDAADREAIESARREELVDWSTREAGTEPDTADAEDDQALDR